MRIGHTLRRKAHLLFLVDAIQNGMAVSHVATFLRRTPDEVLEKAKQLNLVAGRAG
jgi:hypothetical protein